MSSVYRNSDPRPRGRTFLLQMTDAVYLMKLINVTKCHGKFPRDTFASGRVEARRLIDAKRDFLRYSCRRIFDSFSLLASVNGHVGQVVT